MGLKELLASAPLDLELDFDRSADAGASIPACAGNALRRCWSASICDGDPLDLDEEFRAREPGAGDQRARREIVAEDLAAQFGKAVAEAGVGDKDGHRHHVLEAGARLLQRLPQ